MKLFTIKEKDLEDAKALCVCAISDVKNRRSMNARHDMNKVNDILMNAKELKQ